MVIENRRAGNSRAGAGRGSEAQVRTADSIDDFLGGRLRIRQPGRGHRSGSDAVLLAAAVPARSGERVAELGTGVGVALLCLLARVEGTSGIGIDIDAAAVERGLRNAEACGFGERARFLTADLRRPVPGVKPGSFAHVFANPPYFAAGRGPLAVDAGRAAARTTVAGGIEDWIKRAADLLRHGGWLTLIQRSERLEETLGACGRRFGAIEIHPLWTEAGTPAGRFILRARKGLKSPLTLMPGCLLQRNGAYTPEAEAVLRGGAPLFTTAASGPRP